MFSIIFEKGKLALVFGMETYERTKKTKIIDKHTTWGNPQQIHHNPNELNLMKKANIFLFNEWLEKLTFDFNSKWEEENGKYSKETGIYEMVMRRN